MRDIFQRLRETTCIRTRCRRLAGELCAYWIPLWTGRKTRMQLKEEAEIAFWRRQFDREGVAFTPADYRKKYAPRGNIENLELFRDRIVMDVGCGPRGSLEWIPNARLRIGLDPLARFYGPFNIFCRHQMKYLAAKAEHLPLSDRSVDIIFSVNALDHVDDLLSSIREIRRVLRPGGYLLGSINLSTKSSRTEPWCITLALVEEHLFSGYQREFFELKQLADGDHLMDQLWFRVRKPDQA